MNVGIVVCKQRNSCKSTEANTDNEANCKASAGSQVPRLMQVTAEKIRRAIVSGELSLGSKLSEQRLADALGVSRSPVRDALAALAWEDLVTISPKRGTFVFTPDLRAVDDLCEHRVILETSAIRLGIERIHEALMRRLEKSCNEMHSALAASKA